MNAEMRVVGVGASAGGLESLEQLFHALPASSGMAFVVVQHLSPDFRSLMPELIARTGLVASQVLATLSVLEMRRLVRRLPGHQFVRA